MAEKPDEPVTYTEWTRNGYPTRYFYQLILDIWRRVIATDIPSMMVNNSKICTDFEFDAGASTVTINDPFTRVLFILNVTDGITIYNPADSEKGGEQFGDRLVLDFNTAKMADTDNLLIFCESEPDDSLLIDLNSTLKFIAEEMAKQTALMQEAFSIEIETLSVEELDDAD